METRRGEDGMSRVSEIQRKRIMGNYNLSETGISIPSLILMAVQ